MSDKIEPARFGYLPLKNGVIIFPHPDAGGVPWDIYHLDPPPTMAQINKRAQRRILLTQQLKILRARGGEASCKM